jgi:hypothetical protein
VLQVENQTPFVPAMFVLPGLSGIDTVYVTVKATFEIGQGKVRVAEKQASLIPADVYWGDPAQSSLKYAGEVHLCKPATDVVLVGEAYAPGGRPVPHFGLSLAVGKLKRVIHVFGDRTWKSGALGLTASKPAPIAKMPLRFERAYGGRHDVGEGRFLAEMRNPVGVGFLGKRSVSDMKETPLPNLEDPRHAIVSVSDHPMPAGVGYVAPAWQPRMSFAGTYDEAWRKKRAPYFPTDFDPQFFLAAPPDQVYPGYLQGGEPVEIINGAPEGVQRFKVPECLFDVEVSIAGEAHRPQLRIETLLLEVDQGRLSILWRGAVPCDKRVLQIEEGRFSVRSLGGVTS